MKNTVTDGHKKKHTAEKVIGVLFVVSCLAVLSAFVYVKAGEIARSQRPLVLLLEDNAWHECNTQYTEKRARELLDDKGWRYLVKTVKFSSYTEAESVASLVTEKCAEYSPAVLVLSPNLTAILGTENRKRKTNQDSVSVNETVPDLAAGRFRPLFIGMGQCNRSGIFDMVFRGAGTDGWEMAASHLAESGRKFAFIYNSDNDYSDAVYRIFCKTENENMVTISETGNDFVKKLSERLSEEEIKTAVVPYLSEFALCVEKLDDVKFVTDEIHSLLLSGKNNTFGIIFTDMAAMIDSVTNDVVMPYKTGRSLILPLPKIFEGEQ